MATLSIRAFLGVNILFLLSPTFVSVATPGLEDHSRQTLIEIINDHQSKRSPFSERIAHYDRVVLLARESNLTPEDRASSIAWLRDTISAQEKSVERPLGSEKIRDAFNLSVWAIQNFPNWPVMDRSKRLLEETSKHDIYKMFMPVAKVHVPSEPETTSLAFAEVICSLGKRVPFKETLELTTNPQTPIASRLELTKCVPRVSDFRAQDIQPMLDFYKSQIIEARDGPPENREKHELTILRGVRALIQTQDYWHSRIAELMRPLFSSPHLSTHNELIALYPRFSIYAPDLDWILRMMPKNSEDNPEFANTIPTVYFENLQPQYYSLLLRTTANTWNRLPKEYKAKALSELIEILQIDPLKTDDSETLVRSENIAILRTLWTVLAHEDATFYCRKKGIELPGIFADLYNLRLKDDQAEANDVESTLVFLETVFSFGTNLLDKGSFTHESSRARKHYMSDHNIVYGEAEILSAKAFLSELYKLN